MRRPLLPVRRGVSLIEMLVTIFIFSMIMMVVTAMFFVMLQSYNANDAQAQLVENASSIQTRFLSDVNGAYGVLTSATVNGIAYTSGQDTLLLRAASLDADGNPIANTCDAANVNPCDTIVITADPTNASRLLEVTAPSATSSRGAVTKLLTGNLNQYILTYQNADPATTTDVTLTMTLVRTTSHATITHTFHIYGKLRNT